MAQVQPIICLFPPTQDVGYPEFLNIRPYMSQSSGEPVIYSLYAVLVHSGYSCHAGHYYCYVKVGCGPHGHRCLCSSREASTLGPLGNEREAALG